MNIVILDSITVNHDGAVSWKEIEAMGNLRVYDYTKKEELSERMRDADIVIVNKTPLSRQALENAPKLRCVCEFATGYDNVDIAAAKELGIVVCNVPNYGTFAVAQSALALLLELSNRVGFHTRLMGKKEYCTPARWGMASADVFELFGKTLGIIGYGAIGKQFAKIALSLGMKVLAYTRTVPQNGLEDISFVTLDELLSQSDVISLHCPHTPQTNHILNQEAFSKMKKGVRIINTARGKLIDEDALVCALNSGIVSAVGLDVLEFEPAREENPLLEMENCVCTPHIAWAAPETRIRLVSIVTDNIRNFLAGTPSNSVF